MRTILMAGIAVVALAACTQNLGPKQTGGGLLGAGLGGLAGAQIGSGTGQLAATAAGALLGAAAGSEVGTSLDRADRLSTGRPSRHWTRHQVRVPGGPDYQSGGKGFDRPRIIPKRSPTATGCERLADGGFACQADDGTWNIFR